MASKGLSTRRGSVRSITKPAQAPVVPKAPKCKPLGVRAEKYLVDPYGVNQTFLELDDASDPYNYRLALRPRGRAVRCDSLDEEQQDTSENYFEGPNKENVCPHEPKQPRPGSMHHRRGFYQPKPLAPSTRYRVTKTLRLDVCETQVSQHINNS